MLHPSRFLPVLTLSLIFCGLIATGCASTGEAGARDDVTVNVGNYPSAPSGIERPRVGIPPFSVDVDSGHYDFRTQRLDDIAADQMSTLMLATNRFRVIERSQLNQLLHEQNLEGIVEPGELAETGRVRGVDYLLIGKVTAFRVRIDRTDEEAGVGGQVRDRLLDGWGGDVRRSRASISTELGVDFRLVDPETGEVYVAEFTDFKREDTAESMGIDVAGVGASGDADIEITEDDAGKVLRMAFDDALHKAMPRIDQILRQRHSEATEPVTQQQHQQPTGEARTTQPAAEQQPATPRFCGQCGHELSAGARFCGDCGAEIN